MEQLVQHGLDRTKKDAKRKQQANQWLEWIRPLRKAISTGLQATPQAAVPWAGVCCALEVGSHQYHKQCFNPSWLTGSYRS